MDSRLIFLRLLCEPMEGRRLKGERTIRNVRGLVEVWDR